MTSVAALTCVRVDAVVVIHHTASTTPNIDKVKDLAVMFLK